ncbi:zinc finger protein 391 [Salmo salar]|uniref:Zinc finger protein 391 n=1 Tax=Salmo salar TaxID=8030 RepID=A0ABM3EX22_SALSA|nr:zinc finger protein 391-like [Salmo salar]
MAKPQLLTVFIAKRLISAAVNIFGIEERWIAQYQEPLAAVTVEIMAAVETTIEQELSRSKEEIERLRRLLLELGADPQQLTVPEEEVPPEEQHCEQEWSPSLGEQDPEPTQIKEEQEELRTSQEEEQLHRLESDSTDVVEFIFLAPRCVEKYSDQDRERYTLPINTTEQIQTEPNGEDYRVSEPTSDSLFLSAVNPDCSAAHSEIIVSVDEDESEEPVLKTLKSRRTQAEKRQRSQVFTEAKTTSELKEPLKSDTNKKPFKCPVCSKRYKTLGGLKTHQRIHSTKNNHHCKKCGKSFSLLQQWKNHMQTHTEESPTCHVCSKSFKLPNHLKTHMRCHTVAPYMDSGDNPYKCPLCVSSLMSSNELKHIYLGEKPENPSCLCSDCGKCFPTMKTLRDHMRTTHEERRHQCSVCGDVFMSLGSLKVHQRVHTGEKPHQCSVCGKYFAL